MKKAATPTTIRGTLKQLLFSPKGALEGLLLTVDDEVVQVSMPPGHLDAMALKDVVGEAMVVEATADHSPKTRHGAHPVFTLDRLVSIAGKRVAAPRGDDGALKGVVSDIHYARHGEPNGVILRSGEFIHLRPHGMKQAGLRIGSKIEVRGERRMTALGSALIEATHVNGEALE